MIFKGNISSINKLLENFPAGCVSKQNLPIHKGVGFAGVSALAHFLFSLHMVDVRDDNLQWFIKFSLVFIIDHFDYSIFEFIGFKNCSTK